MEDLNQNDTFNFDLPKNQSSVIKVIGVGGGGSNAVNHMFKAGIKGVDFAICNTDSQALSNSPVPNKIQLGVNLTEGLGAGANPEVGQQAAIENIEEIKNVLNTNTKMVFITAGMGGGTGTGAAPVIAKTAKDADILTVGIVTIPFQFEGNNRKIQAEKGIEALRKNVDSLIVINNNKLREVYGNLGFKAGFSKADEVLAIAARGIAEVITHHYTTNIDLRDAKTVLANSGTAIMGSGKASGENRAHEAISGAMDSPLLNDNHIRGAKNVLLLIVSGQDEITIDEIGEINDFIQNEAGGGANIIMGIGEDESLEDEIAVTIVATGFAADQQVQVIGREPQKVVHTLDDEQEVSASLYTKPLKQEQEEDDDMVERELARLQDEPSQSQADLFSIDEPADEIAEPEAQTEEEKIEAVEPQETQEEKQIIVHELDTESEETVTEAPNPQAAEASIDEVETSEPVEVEAEADEEKVEMAFFIHDEETTAEVEEEQVEEKPEIVSEEIPKPITPKEEEETVVKHTLEDYLAMEKHLNESKYSEEPEAKAAEVKTHESEEESDEALNFELKVKESPEDKAKEQQPVSRTSFSDMTIEESTRLRQEERRAQLKKFNHTFQAHTRQNIEKTEDIPAYKRQGLDLDVSSPSNESNISRFSIDEGSEGNDIKGNNSFLHDNVD
jgi:cell division protein FtsZ